jgi:hypothetical protein
MPPLGTLTLSQPRIESDVLKYVVDDFISKGQELLAAGSGADRVADIGTVLGRIDVGVRDAAYAARAGNTGNFTNAFATPKVAAGAKLGVYAITFTAATKFRVEDPDGIELGEGTLGVAFTNVLKLTLTAGGTPAVVGDAADVTVTETAVTTKKVVPINFAAVDGSQNAYAVSLSTKTAKDGGVDAGILTLRRLGCIDTTKLIWPGGATDLQKAGALAQLAANFIIARDS